MNSWKISKNKKLTVRFIDELIIIWRPNDANPKPFSNKRYVITDDNRLEHIVTITGHFRLWRPKFIDENKKAKSEITVP